VRDEHVFDGGGMHEQIGHIPLGVVLNISAWNYPYFVGCNVIVPALLTGNAVLYKPSEHATLTGQHITRLLHEAGVPADVMQCLVGGGEVGAALLAQRIDGVFFTGSHATGVKIAQAVAHRMVKLQLELGGKDPMYVRADVDVKAAAESLADGAMYNTGQGCCSVERIYVHEAVHDAFVEHFVATVRGMQASATRPTRQLHRRHHARAAAAGAAGPGGRRAGQGRDAGRRRPVLPGPGNWFEPTVLTHVNHGME
jgi:acyl-CoA reductase-like NAD-dependent aldehyde dehydrogenase